MARYMVTGCAGFIGSHLTARLLESGNSVIGVDAFRDYYSPNLKEANVASLLTSERFELVTTEISALDTTDFTDVDGVFHLAAQVGVRSSWGANFNSYTRDNIIATQRVFEMVPNGTPVVFASSSSVYGMSENYPQLETAAPAPISPYGVTKAACELLALSYVRTKSLRIVALRYFTVYGPRQRPDMAFTKICLALLSRTEFPLTGDGLQARDFTYVDDAVTATIMAMRDAPTGIYNVGGGKPVSMRSAIELFEASSDMKLKVRPIPEQSGDVRRTDANFLKLHDVTGWRPAHDVTTGIDAQWRWAIGRRMELLAATGHGLQAPHGRED